MALTLPWRAVLAALPLALGCWLGVLALAARLDGAEAEALVLWPPENLVARLPPEVAVTSEGPVSLTLRGGEGLVAALYAAGAPLVLPAGLAGCLPGSG